MLKSEYFNSNIVFHRLFTIKTDEIHVVHRF